jgi:hypothetical protein
VKRRVPELSRYPDYNLLKTSPCTHHSLPVGHRQSNKGHTRVWDTMRNIHAAQNSSGKGAWRNITSRLRRPHYFSKKFDCIVLRVGVADRSRAIDDCSHCGSLAACSPERTTHTALISAFARATGWICWSFVFQCRTSWFKWGLVPLKGSSWTGCVRHSELFCLPTWLHAKTHFY